MNINSASESSQDLDKSFSSFNASSRQIKMEEGENGKPMDDINVRTGVILSTSAPENTTYHQRLTHALMGESVHLHQDNAAGEARRHTTKIYDDCGIASNSNDGSDYSGCFSNDEEEKEEDAPDFGHNRDRALEMNQGPHHIQSLNQSVASSPQSDTEDGDDHVYGTYVLDMASNGPASITTRNTDRMQRRGTMETAHTTDTHKAGEFLSIPDGSNDGNTETPETDYHNSPAREGIFFTIKMGFLILLTCCSRSDPEDDVAEAVHTVGKKTQPLAAPAKIATPLSAAETQLVVQQLALQAAQSASAATAAATAAAGFATATRNIGAGSASSNVVRSFIISAALGAIIASAVTTGVVVSGNKKNLLTMPSISRSNNSSEFMVKKGGMSMDHV